MKKIIISSSIIGVIAVMAIGATVAFFNDTETSKGNVFIAGSVDLKIDSFGASYNGEDIETPGSVWTSRNLTNQKFFSFDDIKPGDYGMRHISVHVDGNPAWACLLVTNKEDGENDLNDAERDAGDATPDKGELSRSLHAFGWQDDDSDGRYDPQNGEKALKIHGDPDADLNSFFDVFYDLDIADAESDTDPLPPNGPATTRNVALAWCAGTQSVNHQTGAISCDGSGMGDDAQSDSFSADVVLYGEQVRNNPNFRCADVRLPSLHGE